MTLFSTMNSSSSTVRDAPWRSLDVDLSCASRSVSLPRSSSTVAFRRPEKSRLAAWARTEMSIPPWATAISASNCFTSNCASSTWSFASLIRWPHFAAVSFTAA